MNTIIFECETVTPMFLTGADSKKPEFRAPSIKGLMRFWWRAIQVYEQTTEWLKKDKKQLIDLSGNSDLVKEIISLNSPEYRAVTAEVLAFFKWLSRFAEGLIKGDETDEQKNEK